jgi:tripartite-type tricarboxylate transporter receptor subunit TctC
MADVLKAGTVRALAVTTEDRLDMFPDVPTVAEAGYPALTGAVGWSGFFGPKGMDKEVVNVYAEMFQKMKSDPDWLKTTKSLGAIPNVLTPAQSEEFVMKQYSKFENLGKKMNIIIQ